MTQAAAPAADAPKKEAGPAQLLRGVSKGQVNFAIFAAAGAKPADGYVVIDGKKTQFTAFFNTTAAKDGKPASNFITLSVRDGKDEAGKDKYKTLGYGHAMNSRKDNEPVYFDTVLFNIEGKTVGARVTQAGMEFHEKMGFTSARIDRPKAEKADGNDEQAGEAAEAGQAQAETACDRPRGG